MNNKLQNKMDNHLDGGKKPEKGFALNLDGGKKSNKGFTLVELLIAMAIFVMFTGIVIRSYADIVYSQKGANEYRLLYSDARDIMDGLIGEIRENSVYYGLSATRSFNSGQSALTLVSKDSQIVNTYLHEDGKIFLNQNISCGREKKSIVLNEERVFIEELSFYITPSVDPYSAENSAFNSVQFHPKVSVYLKVSSGRYEIDFQTTVSSRLYSTVPNVDITCI